METQDTSLTEVLPLSALESITRGEIDMQIATAHRYPRSMSTFKKRALDMALIDEETAESCIYCRPVGMKDGKQQFAEGLSIRLAEIVGACYGNVRVGSMIIEQTERMVKCRGFAHDLESNFASTSEAMEPTVTKRGEPFSEGMRAVVAKACLAKAWRDALFKVVPRALCKPIEAEVRKLAAGEGKSLETRRVAAMQWVNKLGIDPARVFSALGITGEADMGSEHLVKLFGLKTAIKDGEVKIEEAFPPLDAPKTEATKPSFLGKDKPAKTEAQPTTKPEPTQPQRQEAPGQQQEAAPDDSAERTQLLDKIEEARAADGVDTKTVRAWAHRNKLCESDRLALKSYPLGSLRAIVDRWSEIASKDHPEGGQA